jgi:tryptophan synthase beta chain
LETNRPLAAKGEEVTISYVPAADNLELMMSYGFALRGNRNDRIDIPMTEKTSTRLRLGALRYALEDVGLMSAATSEDDIRRLIAIVGSACIIPAGANITDDDWELSAEEAERQIGNAQTIAEAWEDELDAFPTTLEADEELLETKTKYATAFGRAALLFRIERKRLLKAGIDAMYEYINWLYADDEEEETADTLPAGMA